MQLHELEAWLGPALDELTDDQVGRIHTEAHRIENRFHDDDGQRAAALSAVVQYILGETTPEEAGRTLLAARAAEIRAYAAAETIAVMAHADGMPEAAAARVVGIDRMSLRKALGKR